MNANQLISLIRPNFPKKHSLDAELIVSLTSYPKRFDILPTTINSLLNQTVAPDRIILWLYREDFDLLPTSVREFERRGLQILLINEDWKSYKKIIPTLLKFPDTYIITCDDDILYKPTLIEELVDSHQNLGGPIAQRGHIVQINSDGKIEPYLNWMNLTPPKDYYEFGSTLVFPTGAGGVLYPPNCFVDNVTDMKKALELCPTADDIWLYFMAIQNGSYFSLIGDRGMIDLNTSSTGSLWEINSRGANDTQLESLINEFGMPSSLTKRIKHSLDKTYNRDAVKLKNNMRIKVKCDHIGEIIAKTENFIDPDLISYVKRQLMPQRYVDVGAGIGNYALGFAAHPDYQVLCFEADCELSQTMADNLVHNSINFEVFNHCLGKTDEELILSEGKIEVSKTRRPKGKSSGPLTVKTKRLDDCIPTDFDVDVIRIDTGELILPVLRGAKNTILQHRPALILKHGDYGHYCECKDTLLKLGYLPKKVFCDEPTFLYLFDEKVTNTDAYQFSWVDTWSDFSKRNFIAL